LDSIIANFNTLLYDDIKLEMIEIIKEFSEIYPERVEFASYHIRSTMNVVEEKVFREEIDEVVTLLEDLRGFLENSKCSKVSSYTSIMLMTEILNRVFDNLCPENENFFISITILWERLLEFIFDFPEFANFTPIFLSLRRWQSILKDRRFDIILNMFKSYVKKLEDEMTISNLKKAMEIANVSHFFQE